MLYPAHLSYRESGHIMTGDKFRVDPRFLKGKIEETYSQAVPHRDKVRASASNSSNSEEDNGESMGRAGPRKRNAMKQGNSGDRKCTMGKSKEETFSPAHLLSKDPAPASHTTNSEEDNNESLGLAAQRKGHVIEQDNSDGCKDFMAKEVGVASLTSLTTSKDNCPPVIPSQKNTSSGYSHHPTGENQAEEEENVKSGSNSGNPWGKGSYSDLITMALMSSPERKMTLDEIYRWISVNIPYFRNKGDEISSSGWKNSIRHTLCVRQKFVRLPRVTNGSVSRKSWWTINDDFLQKRSDAGAKASLPATNEKYANKETQTEQFVCGVCSFAHAVPRSR
ncbi:hypothetical protein ACROYT_G016311 [Oculina patagonica]